MSGETPGRRRRRSELISAMERGVGRLLLDVEIDPHDRRRLALDVIETLASAGLIIIRQRRHRPTTATADSASPPDNSDTFKGKTG